FPRRFRGQLHRVSDGTVIGGEFESGGLGAVLLSFVLWSMVALLAGFFVAGLLSYLRWVAVFDATAGIVVMCICVGFALLAFGLKAALERATRKEKAFVLDYVGGELKGVQIAPAETQGA
ncbi:MAG TPA: hypothetical protein VMT00_13585, partial [Thermoanaerobaculia bacterium]|nr:hypothetical protein [Thermoanaerobaculia bacterium]